MHQWIDRILWWYLEKIDERMMERFREEVKEAGIILFIILGNEKEKLDKFEMINSNLNVEQKSKKKTNEIDKFINYHLLHKQSKMIMGFFFFFS